MNTIKYKIVKHIANGTEVLAPRTLVSGTNSYKDCLRKLDKYTMSAGQNIASPVLEGMKRVSEEELLDGKTVDWGLFTLKLSIQGKFESENDLVDLSAGKHKLKINIAPSQELMDFLCKNVKFERVYYSKFKTEIFQVINQLTKVENQMKVGQLMEINGNNLKFSKNETDGVYLLDSTQKEYKIGQVPLNSRKRILFMVPNELPVGNYKLGILTTISKSIKKTTYEKELILS